MKKDKAKQFVALVGGFLGTLYLALNASGISTDFTLRQLVDSELLTSEEYKTFTGEDYPEEA